MMSSRELVDNLLRRKAVERTGIYDHGPWGETYHRWIKEGYPTEKAAPDQEPRPVSYVEYFRYDMFGAGGWFDWTPIRGFREVIDETNECITIRNGAGAVIRNFKTYASTPEWIDFRMTTRNIWEQEYRRHLLETDRKRLNIADTKKRLEQAKEKGFWTFYGGQFLWEDMRNSLGNKCMLESMLLEPEWIHDFNRVYTDFYKNHFRLLIEEAGKPDGIWLYEDLGYRNALMCSPKTLGDLIMPYYKELVDFFHTYDLPVILHTDGRIDEAIPLIIEAGFSGLNPMERKAGCDPFVYAEKYGDKLVFVGGFDARILESGDKALIKREIVALMKGMKERGARFMFGVDHSIPPGVSYGDFKYAIEVYRDNMMY